MKKNRVILAGTIFILSVVFCLLALTLVKAAWDGDSLIHEWLFESNGNDAKSNNDLTVSGATYVDSIISGSTKALNFTGSDYAYNVSSIGISGFPFTFSAWVNTTDTTSGHNMIMCLSYADLDNLYYGGGVESGNISAVFANFEDGTVEITCNNTVADGDWHLLTWIFAANNDIRLYVDGSSACNLTSGSGSFNGAINEFNVGRKEGENPGLYFTGMVDNARHWNKSLTQAEILTLYNAEAPTGPTSLLITNVQNTSITNESATISWTTNIDSDSNVTYWNPAKTNNTLSNGLLHGFDFDTDNTTQPDSIGSASGAVSGATFNASGKINGAYDYDGTTDKVTLSSMYDINDTDFTVSVWIIPEVTNQMAIWGNRFEMTGTNNKISCRQQTDQTVYFIVKDTSASNFVTTQTLNTNQWNHLVLTRTGSTYTTYINNVKEIFSSRAGDLSTNQNWVIGDTDSDAGFNKQIDAFYVWNRVLSDNEVQELYNSFTGLQTPFNTLSSNNSTYTTSHSIDLTGLNYSTLYEYNVSSSNVTFTNTSGIYNFTTTANPTINISSVSASVTNESVVITWTTNIASNSTVNLGLTTNLGTYVYNTTVNTSHLIIKTGLNSSTTYYYNVTSAKVGDSNTSGGYSFTTSVTAYNSDYLGRADGAFQLFIDINNPACNDSYNRTQALVGTTPWCHLYGNEAKITSNDTVWIRGGEYNIDGNHIELATDPALGVTIKPYNTNETVIFSNYDPDYLDTPNALWTQDNATANTWYTSKTVTTDKHCHVAFEDNHTYLPSYNAYTYLEDEYDDLNYPIGVYCSNSESKIYIRLGAGQDPNDIGLYISSEAYEMILITGNKWSLYNITILHSTTPVNINNGDFTTIDGFNITGTTKRSVYVISGADGVKIYNTYLNAYFPDNFPWTTIKTNAQSSEIGGIWGSDMGSNNEFINNTVISYFNGIFSETSDNTKAANLKIIGNNISVIYDDAIEIESYHKNYTITNNTITDTFTAVSIAPANSDSSYTTYFDYNIFSCDRMILSYYTGATPTYWSGRCLKIDRWGAPVISVNNMIFNHTTFYSENGAQIVGTTASGEIEDNLINVTIANSIFFHNSTSVIMYGSGEFANNVIYDYNDYYQLSDIGDFAQYWNSYTNSTTFANFSEAFNSASKPGAWDNNSFVADPNFVAGTFQPTGGSSVCTASNTGSFIGALPCSGAVDSCTYSSGAWNILCSDNCEITSNTDIGNNDLILSGTGTFTINANIICGEFATPSTCDSIIVPGKFIAIKGD